MLKSIPDEQKSNNRKLPSKASKTFPSTSSSTTTTTKKRVPKSQLQSDTKPQQVTTENSSKSAQEQQLVQLEPPTQPKKTTKAKIEHVNKEITSVTPTQSTAAPPAPSFVFHVAAGATLNIATNAINLNNNNNTTINHNYNTGPICHYDNRPHNNLKNKMAVDHYQTLQPHQQPQQQPTPMPKPSPLVVEPHSEDREEDTTTESTEDTEIESAEHAETESESSETEAEEDRTHIVHLSPSQEEHLKLMKFWSTKTDERTERFQEIILMGEIGYEDFAAIMDNTFGKPSWEWMKEPQWGIDPDGSTQKEKLFTFPRQLKLDCNTKSDLDQKDSKQVFQISLRYKVGNDEIYNIISLHEVGHTERWHYLAFLSQIHPGFSSDAFEALTDIMEPNGKSEPDEPNRWSKSISKQPNSARNITKENIDEVDLSTVNIYHLIPKRKHQEYFWGALKSMDTGFIKVNNDNFKNQFRRLLNPPPLTIEQFFGLCSKYDYVNLYGNQGAKDRLFGVMRGKEKIVESTCNFYNSKMKYKTVQLERGQIQL